MTKTCEGIDVSAYQGKPAWGDVRRSGKRFAAIKATEGITFVDPQFGRNWPEAKRNGLLRASYHFLRANSDGKHQASNHHAVVRSMGGFVIGDAVMLDIETSDGQDNHTILSCAEAFVREMLHETQAGIFIYVGSYFWRDTLGNPRSPLLAKCPWWVPSYGADPLPCDNWPAGPTIWQYADNGKVPGIAGDVDLDRAFCDVPTLRKLFTVGGRK